jgi:hypothetical protein
LGVDAERQFVVASVNRRVVVVVPRCDRCRWPPRRAASSYSTTITGGSVMGFWRFPIDSDDSSMAGKLHGNPVRSTSDFLVL